MILTLSPFLITTIIIVSVILILFIFIEVLGFVLLKKHSERVEKRNYNMNVLLAQKYDILVLLAKVF